KVYAAEAGETRANADKEKRRLEGDIDKLKGDLKDAGDALVVAKNNLAEVEKQVKLAGLSTQNATGELLRLKDELTLEQAKVRDGEPRMVGPAKTAKEQQEKAVQANTKARTFEERSISLAQALEQSSPDLELSRQGKSAARPGGEPRPPPEDVEGTGKN